MGGLRKGGRGCITACPIFRKGTVHRVGRVLSFFSSRRYWDSPKPLTRRRVCPSTFGSGGRGTLAGEWGGWESPNSNEGNYTVVLFIYMYFVLAKKKGSGEREEGKG